MNKIQNKPYSKKMKVLSVILTGALLLTSVHVVFSTITHQTDVEQAVQNTAGNLQTLQISQQLTGTYDKMAQAVENHDVATARKIAGETLDGIQDIRNRFEKNNQEINKVVSDINSDELREKQEKYETVMEENFSHAEKYLTDIAQSDTDVEKTFHRYSELFTQPKEDDLSNNAEFHPDNVIREKYKTADISKAKKISDKVESLSLDTTLTSQQAETQLTGDVALSDEIKQKADELETPFKIYEFVRNNVSYEAYYGARKGATGTYDSLEGNDTDIASLLIGMLRYKGYRAVYANGKVRMSAKQAMDLTLADNVASAAQILTNMGKDVMVYTENGEITIIEMNRTWVQAYLPYTDYRGKGNAFGEYKWIPLDASFKQYSSQVLELENYNGTYEEYSENVNKANELLKELPEYNTKLSSYFTESYSTANGTMTIPYIVPLSTQYLPLSLPYDVISEKTSSVVNNLVDSDTITISVGYTLRYTTRTADVYNKSITLDYSPASASDTALIEQYKDIRHVPAYMLTLVPTINIDDVPVAKGSGFLDEITSGTVQNMYITLSSGGISQTECDKVSAGSVYAIVLDYGMMSYAEYENAYQKACNNNMNATTMNIYSSEILGSFLTFIGRTYYCMTDVPNKYSEYTYNVSQTKAVGIAIVSYELVREVTFGYISSLTPGSFHIDVEFNSSSVVDLNAKNDNANMFNMIIGFSDSSSEARVWETVLGTDGISTVDIISYTLYHGKKLVYITADNIEDELAKINISAKTKDDVRNFVNCGYTVIIPEEKIDIDDWSGTGFIALNFENGSSTYRLSGGTNGGGTPSLDDLSDASYYVDQISDEDLDRYVYASIFVVQHMHRYFSMKNYMSLLKGVTKMTSSVYAGNVEDFIFGGLGLANTLFSINTDVKRYYGTLDGIIKYFAYNDVSAGREIVKNAMGYLSLFCGEADILSQAYEKEVGKIISESFEHVLGWNNASEKISTISTFIGNIGGGKTPWKKVKLSYYFAFSFETLTYLAS